ncbi:MAG: ATP-dependent RNA helicase HrpA, partial [Planctomycetales bacterium]|nr:ATP-dependent RNA helicase HrpA [Planctomycetales bacterium]
YVVDTGTARISRYAPKSKIQRLPIEPVSRASADQRKGRCGRVAPGICIRLYGEEDYASRADYTTPEIQRTNLASVILQAASLNLGPVERFPFLDPPRPESIRDGYRTLFEIGAVDERHHLTERGRRLSRLPVDPRIGRIILAAHEESCLADVLIIAAALETQDPRDRPYERRQLADERHAQFHDDRSDFLSYLKIWDFYHDLKERLSRNQLQRACINNFLSPTRLREWTEVHRQLMQLVANDRMSIGRRSNRYDAIHRALLAGYLSGVAMRTGDHEYTGAGGIKFHLWPGSCLLGSKPTWIVCGELVETSRRFGRTVAKIEPDWIERLAQHLVKRHYSEPHWYDKTGAVMAHERVTLWGLPIVAQRRVHYHKIDPVAAREIFIREGLRHSVGHVWEAAERDENGAADPRRALQFAFFRHNEQTLRDVERLASRSRRADLLVDQFKLYRFYDARIPSDVCDLDRLRRWLKGSPDNEHLLTMSPGDFDDADVSDKGTANFPDTVTLGILDLPAHYHFEPGADDDGVTLDVPQAALAQLTEGQLAWLVPGVLEEKLTAIIRALPKGIRRNLIPAPDTARQVAAELTFGEGDFWTAVLGAFSRIAGEPIEMSSVRLDKLPPHLRMNVRVLDDEGNAVAEGCDLKQLQNSITFDAPTTSSSVAIDQRWHRDALTSWDLGELPEQVLVRRGSIDVPAYPALVDNHADVQLR